MNWLKRHGGIEASEQRSITKSQLIYDVINSSNGFYSTPVADANIRSRMNVPFNIKGGDEAMTDKFLIESWEKGLVGLRTMTPFGTGEYLRASLYNGVSLEDTKVLAEFMQSFATQNA